MEHKLIEGGEVYLPFARSRIKALRSLGMAYASQRFVMPDGEVSVRIEPGQDYIHLTGDLPFLSGVIREGEVVKEDPESRGKLHEYMPTAQAWKYQKMDKEGATETTYHDESRLVVKADEAQYADIAPSMFSGLMAKAVAAVMAQGKQVKYDYRWDKCHGILLGPDDVPWLIEISSSNGVLLMRLQRKPGDKKSKQDAIKSTTEEFKGIPTGGTFPADEDLPDAISEGLVLQLLTAAELAPVYSKSAYSSALGWSFNNHDAAHNTCYLGTTGYHYKIEFTIEKVEKDRSESDPFVQASAALVEVESGVLHNSIYGDYDVPFSFYDPLIGRSRRMPYVYSPGIHNTPILAYHHEGVLEVVRLKSDMEVVIPGDPIPYPSGTPYAFRGSRLEGDSYVSSDTLPGNPKSSEGESTWSSVEIFSRTTYTGRIASGEVYAGSGYYLSIDLEFWFKARIGAGAYTTYLSRIKATLTDKSRGRSRGMWPNGMRDGYIHYEEGGVTAVGGADTITKPPFYDPYEYAFSRHVNGDRYGGSIDHWEVYEDTGSVSTSTYKAILNVVHTPASPGGGSLSMPSGPLVEDLAFFEAAKLIPEDEPIYDGEPIYLFGERMIVPDRIIARVPNGENIESNPIYANQTERDDYHAAWRSPPLTMTYPVIFARISVFGKAQHAAISKNLANRSAPDIKTHGALFTDELDPSSFKYNFIGYI